MEEIGAGLIEFGVASRALEGQKESGDRHIVAKFPEGILIGVVDGLGHGRQAAAVAQRAASLLTENAREPLHVLFEKCHKTLRGSRGAVVSLAKWSPSEKKLTWAGVGNVEGVLLRSGPHHWTKGDVLSLRSGVVGDSLPALAPQSLAVDPEDMLIFATDGVRSDFAHRTPWLDSAQKIADQILLQSARGTDDSLVLVARFRYLKEAARGRAAT